MADGPAVARGSVLLTPKFENLTKSISDQLSKAMSSASGASAKGGSQAGAKFASGFAAKAAASGMAQQAVSSAAAKAAKAAEAGGGSSGSRFLAGLSAKLGGLPTALGSNVSAASGSAAAAAGSGGGEAGSRFSSGFAAKAGAVAGLAQAAVEKACAAVSSALDSAISRVDTMNNFPRVMSGLGYSADDASAAIQKMSDHLTGLPTRLDAMTSSVQKIVPTVKDVGRSTDIMLAFNDALLAGGAATSVQESALEQFSQVLAKGKPELEDWRSIQTAMPGQLDQVAQAMLGAGSSSMDLYNAMKEGSVTVEDLEDAFISLDQNGYGGFASFAEQAKNGTAGIATSMANLQNSVVKGVAKVIDAIGVENVTAPMEAAKGVISGAADFVAGKIGEVKDGFSSVPQALSGFQPAADAIAVLGGRAETLGAALSGAASGIIDFAAHAAASEPVAAALAAAGGLVSDAFALIEHGIEGAGSWLSQFFAAAEQNGAVSSLSGVVEALGGIVSGVGELLLQAQGDLFGFADGSGSAQGAADLLKGALDAARPVIEGAKDAIGWLVDNLDLVEPAAAAVATAFGLVKGALAINSAIGAVNAALSGGLLPALVGAASKTTLFAGAQAALNAVMSLNPFVLVAIAVAALVAGIVALWNTNEGFREAVTAAWSAISEAASAAWGAIVEFFTSTIPSAIQGVIEWFAQLPEAIGQAIQAAIDWFAQLPVSIATLLGMAVGFAAGFVVTMGQYAIDAGLGFLSNAASFFAQLPGNVAGFLSSCISNIGSWVSETASNAAQAGSQFLSNVGSFLSQLPGNVAGWLSGALSSIAQFAAGAISQAAEAGQGFLDGVSSGFSAAVDFIGSIPGQVMGFFAGVGGWLYDSGKALLDGFVNGILAGFSAAQQAVSDGLSTIREFFPFSPAKRGPFSGRGYTTFSGAALMQGLAAGVESAAPLAALAAGTALAGVRSAMECEPITYTASASVAAAARMSAEASSPSGSGGGLTKQDIISAVLYALQAAGLKIEADAETIAVVLAPYIDDELGRRKDMGL